MVTICFAKSVQTQGDGKYQMGNSDKHRYESGQSQFALINKESENPQYGKCWTTALTKVTEGCKKLTDDEQSRMALALTNCHLEKAGFTTLYPCSEDQSTSSCLSPMQTDIAAFNAYTEFFTHSQNICFFLQSQVWHEKTEETVSKLAKSSEVVADQLEVTSNLQSAMMEKQTASMQNQEVILRNEEYLREALKSSADSVRDIFDEMKTSTGQQQLLFDKTFERINVIQRLILGEFSWIQSLLFYVAAILIVYIATSAPRSAGARLWMFGVVLLSWVTERALFSWNESEDEETIYRNVWLCRKISSTVAFVILLGFVYYYEDYNQLNHKLLVELHEKVGNVVNRQITTDETNFSPLPVKSMPAVKGPSSLSAITSPYQEDRDITYMPNQSDYSSDSDTESFVSALPGSRRPSRPTTPVILDSGVPILIASSFNRSEMDMSKLTFTSPHGEISVTVKKRGRPKGSKNNTSRNSTPFTSPSGKSPYNLRRRSQNPSPNPLLDRETVDTFIKTVEGKGKNRLSSARISEIE
ncbi:hypothetical protein BSL78_10436 [Apostichopus japonicus]|uniref:Uncharacterized protein n=1 Tax=Stichopus japonicus TaxID=307972 RepID=A0A2G8KXE6_STIJA|nr:hypothetical protein BSL78_10436 [Apostichopus japonicus]